MSSCIHFIRHGITEGILNKWYYGWEDMPLAPQGIENLQELKAKGIYPKLNNSDNYTSGMIRANQTLEVIWGDVPFTALPKLKELNFGEWECKTFDQLKELDGFEEWINDPSGNFRFPGGESPSEFHSRCDEGLKELIDLHRLQELSNKDTGKDSVSVIVCHGGVIASAMCLFMNKPQNTFWDWVPDPGRGYTFYFEDGKVARYEPL
jgi:alpha-ribazole phosphatase